MVVHREMLARLSLHSGPLSQILEDDPTGKDLKGKAKSVLYVPSTSLHFSFSSHTSWFVMSSMDFCLSLTFLPENGQDTVSCFFFPVASVTFICVDQRRCFISKGSHCNWRVSS